MKINLIIVPVEVSARHIHLSKNDLENLFGQGYELKKIKQLSQPSDFACQETVDIKVGDKNLKNIRVIGPEREKTQVEISKTDAFFLKVNAPLRLSGDIHVTPGVTLIGPKGKVDLQEGLIVAKRHLHCATSEAKELGLKNNDIVSVKVESERSVIFEDIPVRVKDSYSLCMHIDTDEGNSAGINGSAQGYIISIVSG